MMAIAIAKPPSVSISGLARLETRAILLASCSTAATLRVEALAHHVFERERLDDADALQRFLQRLDDARAAV